MVYICPNNQITLVLPGLKYLNGKYNSQTTWLRERDMKQANSMTDYHW